MPPAVALYLTLAGVVYLFRRDRRIYPQVTAAMWIPLLWVLISGSRLVSQWVYLDTPTQAGFFEDGSPMDRNAMLGLIAAGAIIVVRRRVRLAEVVRQNPGLCLYLLYTFLSTFWADYPFVAFKRWVKTLGEPVMVLVLFSETAPAQALMLLLKRAGYVLVFFSVTLIKYYPAIGRKYSWWTGEVQNSGVANDKNGLGYLCMVFGIFFFWHFLNTWRLEKSRARREELAICAAILGSVVWFLTIASAQTAFLTFSVGIAIVLLLGSKVVSKRYVGALTVGIALIYFAADQLFDASTQIILLLGRDPSITGRTELWRDIFLEPQINPIIGSGFESFWIGERMFRLWKLHWWKPTQAHNGYLETYLNQGLVGITILVIMLLSAYRKIRRALLTNFEVGRLFFAYFVAILLYNYSDYTFTAPHLLYFLLFLIAMEYRQPAAVSLPVQLPGMKATRSALPGTVAARGTPTAVALRSLR